MLTNPTLEQMQALGLAGMAAAYRQLAEQDNTAALSRDEWLGLMLDREVAVRADRRLTNRLAAAKLRFPVSSRGKFQTTRERLPALKQNSRTGAKLERVNFRHALPGSIGRRAGIGVVSRW